MGLLHLVWKVTSNQEQVDAMTDKHLHWFLLSNNVCIILLIFELFYGTGYTFCSRVMERDH